MGRRAHYHNEITARIVEPGSRSALIAPLPRSEREGKKERNRKRERERERQTDRYIFKINYYNENNHAHFPS
jgi:hypothetical protein